jgi:hypothetical protein
MRTTRRLVALLAALAGCLGAVAYAAAPHQLGSPAPSLSRVSGSPLPKPTLNQHPNKLAVSKSARFSFAAKGRRLRFQCQLDGRAWNPCRSPVAFTGLSLGTHKFAVRAMGPGGGRGRAARFGWRVLEPKDFSIAPQLSGLGDLYPGAPPLSLPLTISNPNSVPIFVTSLSVTTTANAPGCTSADNLALSAAGISSAAPLKVPANGSVGLPAAGVSAPTIQLRDLPVNQDACQGATFPLSFSGNARG